MIECNSNKGTKKLVSKEKLCFRPSVYAVVIDDGKVLLITSRAIDKYYFPGGGIELGETIETALKREVEEETGLKIEIKRFINFKEKFIYYEDSGSASHNFSFFYLCKPLSFDLASDSQIIDDDARLPQWIELTELDKNRCAGSILEILQQLNLI